MPFVVRLPNDEYGVPRWLWATRSGRKRYKVTNDINAATVWQRRADASKAMTFGAEQLGMLGRDLMVEEVEIVPEAYLRVLLSSIGITTVNEPNTGQKCNCVNGCKSWDCDKI